RAEWLGFVWLWRFPGSAILPARPEGRGTCRGEDAVPQRPIRRSRRRRSQVFPNDRCGDVPLAMRHGDHFNQTLYRPIENQVIPNGPKEDRTMLGQMVSPMAH